MFMISSANAIDINSADQNITEHNDNSLKEIQIKENTLSDEQTQHTISDLANNINNSDMNEITLEGAFVYDEGTDYNYKDGLQINRNNSLTINGNDNLIIEGNLNFNVSKLTFTKTVFNNCILCNFNGSTIEFYNCKFTNSYFFNHQNISFFQCDISQSNVTNYGSLKSEGWSMNPNRYSITCSNITNYGSISFLSQSISQNNLLNWASISSSRSYLESNHIENNGGTINLTTLMEHNNITNNEGIINLIKVYFVFNNMTNYAMVNFLNDGNFISDEYIENNLFVNFNGTIKFASGFFSSNNMTNYELITFSKADSTSDNIKNYGNLKYLYDENDYYEGFANYIDKENITNYGNLTIQSTKFSDFTLNNHGLLVNISETEVSNSSITNYGILNIADGRITDSAIDNKAKMTMNGGYLNNIKLTNTGDLSLVNVDSSTIVINKVDTIVSSAKVTMNYGATKYITIKITDKQGNPVKNTKFTITVNKHNYYATSDANGNAKVKIPALNVGSYKVTISGANEYYNIKNAQTTIKVNKAKTTVKLAKTVKKSKKLKITVESKVTKKAAKSIKIKVKVYTGKKAKSYKIKTNKKGVAQLNTKNLTRGKHKIVITSLDNNYNISKKITIKIK